MSLVTNIVLLLFAGDREAALEIEKIDIGSTQHLQRIDGHTYGCHKYLECYVLVGAPNFVDMQNLINSLRTIDFADPDRVQLLISGQEEVTFTEYKHPFPPGKYGGYKVE